MLLSPLEGEYKDEKDERLPGAGKGGMVQVGSVGKASMVVAAPSPPVIMSPAIEKLYEIPIRFSLS